MNPKQSTAVDERDGDIVGQLKARGIAVRPCPWCQKLPIIRFSFVAHPRPGWFAGCENIGKCTVLSATWPHDSAEKAAEAWNQQAAHPDTARLAELLEHLVKLEQDLWDNATDTIWVNNPSGVHETAPERIASILAQYDGALLDRLRSIQDWKSQELIAKNEGQ